MPKAVATNTTSRRTALCGASLTAQVNPDAELIALCNAGIAACQKGTALLAAPHDDDETVYAAFQALEAKHTEICRVALSMPARTLDGFRAKMQLIEADWRGDVPDGCANVVAIFYELLGAVA